MEEDKIYNGVNKGLKNEKECVNLVSFIFEIVNKYTYLGTILTNKIELRPEL
jgi:hypothetical protein